MAEPVARKSSGRGVLPILKGRRQARGGTTCADASAVRLPGLFEPALSLSVDKLPAVLDEFAPSVPLSERDGKLGLKLGVNGLVVADNGVDVLVWPASGVGERMDRGGHLAGHRPVARAVPLVGWRPGPLGWSPCGRQRWQRLVNEPLHRDAT